MHLAPQIMWLDLTTDTCAEPNGPHRSSRDTLAAMMGLRSTPGVAGEKHKTEQPGSQQPGALALRNQRDKIETEPPAFL